MVCEFLVLLFFSFGSNSILAGENSKTCKVSLVHLVRRGHLVTEKIPPSAFIHLMNAMCPGGLTAAEAGKRIEGSLAGVNTLWQSFVQLAEKKKLQQHSEEVMKEIFWKWRFNLVRV